MSIAPLAIEVKPELTATDNVNFKPSFSVVAWQRHLSAKDPDYEWFMQGITEGFKMVKSNESPSPTVSNNYKSTLQNKDQVDKKSGKN